MRVNRVAGLEHLSFDPNLSGELRVSTHRAPGEAELILEDVFGAEAPRVRLRVKGCYAFKREGGLCLDRSLFLRPEGGFDCGVWEVNPEDSDWLKVLRKDAESRQESHAVEGLRHFVVPGYELAWEWIARKIDWEPLVWEDL